jgi:riboflavin biosynthesis pyrimidine reductase
MQVVEIVSGQEMNFFAESFGNWQGWSASLVIGTRGETQGDDGTSKPLSNPFDLSILLALRSKADLIVTTGETARAEEYRTSRFAPIAVISRRPESLLTLPLFSENQSNRNMVLSPRAKQTIPEALADAGLATAGSKILFEGGLSTLRELIRQGLNLNLIISRPNSAIGSELEALDVYQTLNLPHENSELLDDLLIGQHRVLRFSING